ncbi:MAG: alpha/beta hydrolase family esterase [Thalassobaculum sp.]
MVRPIAFLTLLLLLLNAHPRAQAAEQYEIETGTYRAHVPASWDGATALPLLMFFHGYGQSGGVVMGNAELMDLADREGVLVIAPDGAEKRWAHQGAPARERLRDDDAFVAAVLADAKSRWPVDDARVWASGFSIGGSMAWHLACYRSELFTAFLPTAGAFWRPQPETCPAGPANLMHVHGTGDTVVPMTGRPIRDVYHQGDVLRGIASWREANGCPADPAEVSETGDLRCEIWRGCGSGKELQLCLHPGGHVIPKGYMAKAIAWADGLATGQ